MAQITEHIKDLPSPSPILDHISLVLADDETNSAQVADVLKLEPVITGKVLKLANSAFAGIRGTVSNLTNAVSLLGRKRIHSLVIMSGAMSRFSKEEIEVFDLTHFLKHSVMTGLIAEKIAKKLGGEKAIYESDSYFSAGILHDLGAVVLASAVPEYVEQIIQKVKRDGVPFRSLEVPDFSHQIVGGILLENWNLPQELILASQYHHIPDNMREPNILVDTVHVADIIASISGYPLLEGAGLNSFAGNAVKRVGLVPEMLKVIQHEIISSEQSLSFLWETL